MARRNRSVLVALVGAVVLVAAACSSSGDDGDGQAEADGAGAAGAPGAAEGGDTTGVTGETVKIAVMVNDNEAIAELGFAVDIGDTEEQYRVFLEGVEAGGRTVELSFHSFTAIDAETQQAACLGATQDERAFAAVGLGGMQAEYVLCVTEDNETPYLTTSTQQDDVVDRSDGRYFSASSVTFNPAMASAVNALDEVGELEGRTVGVVLSDNLVDRSAVDEGLVPALVNRGYEVAVDVTLPCDGAVCEQHDAAAQQLKDAGVDAVFSTLSAVTMPSLVSAAAAIDLVPAYYATPIGNQDIDVLAQRMEASADEYDGSLAVTPAGRDWTLPDAEPDPFGQACNDRYTEQTGVAHEWGAVEEAGWGAVFSICSMAELILDALDQVGEDLTRERFVEALEAQQDFPTNAVGSGSFGPGKHYAATEVNILEWDRDCSCWVATDGATYPVVEK